MTSPENTEAVPSLCWNCSAQLDSPYQCDRCVKIQPWPNGTDYFAFLGLPRRLCIDLSEIEKRFLKLSRVFHPDFFQDSLPEERDISLVNAARLNQAYDTLKDATSRAGYILELESGAKRKPKKTVPPEIADEIIELQEILADYVSLQENDPAKARTKSDLEKRHAAMQRQYEETLEHLDTLFAEYDRVMDEATSPFEPEVRKKKEDILDRIDQTLAARLYIKRIMDNTAATLEGKDVSLL